MIDAICLAEVLDYEEIAHVQNGTGETKQDRNRRRASARGALGPDITSASHASTDILQCRSERQILSSDCSDRMLNDESPSTWSLMSSGSAGYATGLMLSPSWVRRVTSIGYHVEVTNIEVRKNSLLVNPDTGYAAEIFQRRTSHTNQLPIQ